MASDAGQYAIDSFSCASPYDGDNEYDAEHIESQGAHDRLIVERRHVVAHKADCGKARVDDRCCPNIPRQHIGQAHEKPDDGQASGLAPIVPRRRAREMIQAEQGTGNDRRRDRAPERRKQRAYDRFCQVEQNPEEDENFGKTDGKESYQQPKTTAKLALQLPAQCERNQAKTQRRAKFPTGRHCHRRWQGHP